MSVGDAALLATAVIAAVALVYASRQLRDSRRTARQETTYRYLERINSLDATDRRFVKQTLIEHGTSSKTFSVMAPGLSGP